MSKCVDFEDVKECVKYGIKHGWTLIEFLESMDYWTDFVDANKWIPCKWKIEKDGTYTAEHKMPEDSQEILITIKGKKQSYVCQDVCYYDAMGAFSDSGFDWVTDVTAWMPRPEPYIEGKDK